jgi:hypothetical protein
MALQKKSENPTNGSSRFRSNDEVLNPTDGSRWIVQILSKKLQVVILTERERRTKSSVLVQYFPEPMFQCKTDSKSVPNGPLSAFTIDISRFLGFDSPTFAQRQNSGRFVQIH